MASHDTLVFADRETIGRNVIVGNMLALTDRVAGFMDLGQSLGQDPTQVCADTFGIMPPVSSETGLLQDLKNYLGIPQLAQTMQVMKDIIFANGQPPLMAIQRLHGFDYIVNGDNRLTIQGNFSAGGKTIEVTYQEEADGTSPTLQLWDPQTGVNLDMWFHDGDDPQYVRVMVTKRLNELTEVKGRYLVGEGVNEALREVTTARWPLDGILFVLGNDGNLISTTEQSPVAA